MGTLFSKIASIDPIAQSLDLPGSHSYANSQQQAQQQAAIANGLGPYSGVAPSLAGANAGYVQGGPGAKPGWQPYVPSSQGGLFELLQSAANVAGNAPGVKLGGGGGNSPSLTNNYAPTGGVAYGGSVPTYAQAAQQAGAQSVPQQPGARPQTGAIQRAATGGW